MRRVAPDSAGSAASQNNWLVSNWKPTCGRLTATAENICQIANASSKAGIEIARLRLAIRLPVLAQNAASSGCHSWITEPTLRDLSASCALMGLPAQVERRSR